MNESVHVWEHVTTSLKTCYYMFRDESAPFSPPVRVKNLPRKDYKPLKGGLQSFLERFPNESRKVCILHL